MKTLFQLLVILLPGAVYSQVLINPGTKTEVSSTAVSLEFGEDEFRGIVIPYVTTAAAGTVVNGTIIMDPADKTLYVRANGVWVDYTGDAGRTNSVSTGIQDGKTENSDAKVMIGGNPAADQTKGILVLGDTEKVMVLPRMDSPHLNIKNPAAGMMAYDTLKKQLAVFNGTQWSFWQK